MRQGPRRRIVPPEDKIISADADAASATAAVSRRRRRKRRNSRPNAKELFAGAVTVLGLMLLVISATFTLGLTVTMGLTGLTWSLLFGLPTILASGGLFLLGRWLGAKIDMAQA